jgi:hypothetical protein
VYGGTPDPEHPTRTKWVTLSATAESLLSGRSAKTGRHAIAQVLLQGFDPYTGE